MGKNRGRSQSTILRTLNWTLGGGPKEYNRTSLIRMAGKPKGKAPKVYAGGGKGVGATTIEIES